MNKKPSKIVNAIKHGFETSKKNVRRTNVAIEKN